MSKHSLLKHPKNPKIGADWRARRFWDFSYLLSQIIKTFGGRTLWWKKLRESHTFPKKVDILVFFHHPFCSKTPKKWRWNLRGQFFLSKRFRTNEENIEKTPIEFFFENSLRSPVSGIVPKKWKRGSLGLFERPFCCKIPKNWREDPLDTLRKFAKKVTKPKLHAQNNLVKGETRIHVLLLVRHQKLSQLTSMLSGSRSYKCDS